MANSNRSIFSLVGESVKAPLEVTVVTWEILLDMLKDVTTSKEAILHRIRLLGRDLDMGLALIDVSVRAGLSSALGRYISEEDLNTPQKRTKVLEEAFMPQFKKEEVK